MDDKRAGSKPPVPPIGGEALEPNKSDQIQPDAVVSAEDAGFVPIPAEGFVSGSKSAFDVFVRLSSGRYLKLLKAGDGFTPDRLENYTKKGVTHFYIKKEASEAYRKYSETLTTAALGSKTLSTELKIGQVFNQGNMIMGTLAAQGVTEENLQYASKFIGNVRELVQQLDPEKDELFNSFFSNVATAEHGVGTSMLAGILAYVVEIRMERPVQIVGMAALLHDIGLTKLPETLWAEDEAQMSEQEKALYRTHPKIGADLLRQTKVIDPAALQAIEQHHMRLHGAEGFPEKSPITPMPRVSEIVGICEEFNRLLQKSKMNPSTQLLAELENRVFPGFSKQIVYAFRTAFFPKK